VQWGERLECGSERESSSATISRKKKQKRGGEVSRESRVGQREERKKATRKTTL
jgi:hypothetical protein